jgi:trk system potassium uptake protein TrkA
MKIAIVGAGKLGLRITETLTGGDHSVTVIDKDEELIRKLNATLDIMTVVGNGKEVSLLNEIDIASYDYLIATTDRDEKNIVIASVAKKLGAGKVIARLRDPEHLAQQEFIMDLYGIDYVTNPDLAVAEEINKYLVEKYAIRGGIFNADRVSMIQVIAGKLPHIRDLTPHDAEVALGDVTIAAISRNGKIVIPNDEDIRIEETDDLYIVGARDFIEDFSERVFEKGKYTNLKRVMIAGGGKSGFYLARLLDAFGASVKIIENDKLRCQYLSTHLNNVLVLHGDATDISLLEEEDFTEMDAFVSCTGFDEENLLLALMAKQGGIEDVIAKVSRESYGSLIKNMGVDMALSPIDISASNILRFLQGTKVLSSLILQGQAEITQILIEEDMLLSDKPISRLKLPDGLVIAAIQRGLEVIIPDDDTRIETGDLVIIFSLLSEAFDREKLLRTKQGFLGLLS